MSYAALLLFFVVEYVRPGIYVPALELLKLNSLIPLAAFIGCLASGTAATAQKWAFSDKSTRAVGALLALVMLSVLTATVQTYALTKFLAVLGYSAIYLVIISELTTLPRIKSVFAMLIAVHLVIAALNPVLFTNPDARSYVASGYFVGDGNDFALSIDIALPLCLFLLTNAKVWWKPLWTAVLLVLVACVVLTQSRGGTLGLGAMTLYYWFKSPKKLQTATIAAIAVALILAFAPRAYFNRMNMMTDTSEESASARFTAWDVGRRMAYDNPLFGVGAGNFPTEFGNYKPIDFPINLVNAHSFYFQALGELGVPGLAALLYFIVGSLIANRRLSLEVKKRHGAQTSELQLLATASAAVIAFAVAGAFLSALYYPHMFVIAGLQAAIRNVVRQRSLQQAAASPVTRPSQVTIHPALRRPVVARLVTPPESR